MEKYKTIKDYLGIKVNYRSVNLENIFNLTLVSSAALESRLVSSSVRNSLDYKLYSGDKYV